MNLFYLSYITHFTYSLDCSEGLRKKIYTMYTHYVCTLQRCIYHQSVNLISVHKYETLDSVLLNVEEVIWFKQKISAQESMHSLSRYLYYTGWQWMGYQGILTLTSAIFSGVPLNKAIQDNYYYLYPKLHVQCFVWDGELE